MKPVYYNTNTILLVDDEFDIMTTFTQALEQQGFPVVGFTEPLLALDDFHNNSDRYVGDIRPKDAGYEWISIHKKSQGNKTTSKGILYFSV
jgi:DNA-binding NtrC family response regulator